MKLYFKEKKNKTILISPFLEEFFNKFNDIEEIFSTTTKRTKIYEIYENARKQAFKNHFFESVCTSKIRASRSKLAPKINSTLAKWKIEECVGKRDYETDR